MQDFATLIREVQGGNEALREEVLKSHTEFIARYSSFLCKRKLEWQNDDELSIALLAFNKAIDSFNPLLGNSFTGYARLIIKNSLIDYFRKQQKEQFSQLAPKNGENVFFAELKASRENYYLEEENRERAYEVQRFREILGQFGLSLGELLRKSPRHFDTREKLKEIVKKTCGDRGLIKQIYEKKRLPLKEIQALTGENRKLLDKWRTYLLAMIIVSTHHELDTLSEYVWGKEVQFPGEGY